MAYKIEAMKQKRMLREMRGEKPPEQPPRKKKKKLTYLQRLAEIPCSEELKQSMDLSLKEFVADDERREMTLPASLSSEERKYIHLVAQFMGLRSKSTGAPTAKVATLYKRPLDEPPPRQKSWKKRALKYGGVDELKKQKVERKRVRAYELENERMEELEIEREKLKQDTTVPYRRPVPRFRNLNADPSKDKSLTFDAFAASFPAVSYVDGQIVPKIEPPDEVLMPPPPAPTKLTEKPVIDTRGFLDNRPSFREPQRDRRRRGPQVWDHPEDLFNQCWDNDGPQRPNRHSTPELGPRNRDRHHPYGSRPWRDGPDRNGRDGPGPHGRDGGRFGREERHDRRGPPAFNAHVPPPPDIADGPPQFAGNGPPPGYRPPVEQGIRGPNDVPSTPYPARSPSLTPSLPPAPTPPNSYGYYTADDERMYSDGSSDGYHGEGAGKNGRRRLSLAEYMKNKSRFGNANEEYVPEYVRGSQNSDLMEIYEPGRARNNSFDQSDYLPPQVKREGTPMTSLTCPSPAPSDMSYASSNCYYPPPPHIKREDMTPWHNNSYSSYDSRSECSTPSFSSRAGSPISAHLEVIAKARNLINDLLSKKPTGNGIGTPDAPITLDSPEHRPIQIKPGSPVVSCPIVTSSADIKLEVKVERSDQPILSDECLAEIEREAGSMGEGNASVPGGTTGQTAVKTEWDSEWDNV